MRQDDQRADGIFSYVRLEQRVPVTHPLLAIRDLSDAELKEPSPELTKLYARDDRRKMTRHGGRALVEWFLVLTAYNLIRISKLLAATGSLSGLMKMRQIGPKLGLPRRDYCRSVLSAASHLRSNQASRQTASAIC